MLIDARARGEIRTHWKPLLIVGIANSALPFCLFGYSMLYLSAGFDAILNATTPLWTAAIAAAWLRVPLTRTALIGLALGVIGVGVLVSDSLNLQGTQVPLAVAAVMGATISYGFAANYSRRRLAGIQPTTVAFASMAFATLVLVLPALATLPSAPVSTRAWLADARPGRVLHGRRLCPLLPPDRARRCGLRGIGDVSRAGLRDDLGRAVSRRTRDAADARGLRGDLLGAALIIGRIRLPIARSTG